MKIGENIRFIRALKGLTQGDLAEKTNISRSSIVNFETGKRSPRVDDLENIAKALDVDISTFFKKSLDFSSNEFCGLRRINILAEAIPAIQSLYETCNDPEEITAIFKDLLDNGEANSEKGIRFIEAICILEKYIEILSRIKVERRG